jgi:hypothetical protein
VERSGGRQLPQAEATEAAPQLAGRLTRERQAQRPAGVDEPGARLPGEAAGQHPGLARPGRGQDGNGAVRVGHGPPLGVVEPVEEAVGIHGRHRTDDL